MQMPNAVSTAKSLDWSGWLLGIWTSTISGGAGAVAGVLGPMVTNPEDFNFGPGLKDTMLSMAIGFGITGLVSLAKFLQMHPAPDYEVVATVETTTKVTPVDSMQPTTETTTVMPVTGTKE